MRGYRNIQTQSQEKKHYWGLTSAYINASELCYGKQRNKIKTAVKKTEFDLKKPEEGKRSSC